jgi:hypothetical protein
MTATPPEYAAGQLVTDNPPSAGDIAYLRDCRDVGRVVVDVGDAR